MKGRRLRLIAWIIASTGALAWPVFEPSYVWLQSVFLSTLALLWWAAPRDSIRIPFHSSAVVILGGVVMLQLVAVSRSTTHFFTAIVSVVLSTILMYATRRSNATVWVVAPLVWAWWTMRGWLGVISFVVVGTVIVLSSKKSFVLRGEPNRES